MKEAILRNLRMLVKEKGFTAVTMKSGIPTSHLYHALNSEKGNPNLDTLAKICNAVDAELRVFTVQAKPELSSE